MFKKGDIVKIKSLDEVLEIEGVSNSWDIRYPHISLVMLHYFGKEGVVLGTSSHGNIILAISESEHPYYYNPKWLEKTSDMITLKDFDKEITDLGFSMSKDSTGVEVKDKDGVIAMTVPSKCRGCVDTHWAGFTDIESWETKSKLLELGVRLASTPIDKRESDVKYYLRLPEPIHDDYAYLNRELDLGTYLFGCKYDDSVYKTQFTQEDIDNFSNQEFIKTLIKEEVKDV